MSERKSRQRHDSLPAYVADVLKLGQALQLKRGSIAYVAIRHDPGCPRLLGVGECNCDADVVLDRVVAPVELN